MRLNKTPLPRGFFCKNPLISMNIIKQFLTPLTTPEQSALLRALSDLESGSPRQWLLLEVASHLGAAQASRRVVWAVRLARWLGIATLMPLWQRWQVPGLALYQANARALGHTARQALDDAALLLACGCALLAGFDSLPASRQFVAWLLLLLGGAVKYWRTHKAHPLPELPEITGEETLPGAESALGLQGMLLARGVLASEALPLFAELRAAPNSALPALVAALPELQPPPATRADFLRAALATWCLAIAPALWLNAWQWGWIVVLLWLAALAWLAHGRKTFVALLLGSALASFALARIAHFF